MTSLDIEKQRSQILEELSDLFGHVAIGGLFEAIIAGENYVYRQLRRTLCLNAASIFGATEVEPLAGTFLCGARSYQINVSDNVIAPEVLLVGILPHDLEERPPAKRFRRQSVRIEGYGRYQKVDIFLPPGFSADREMLAHLIKVTLETIYSWIEERVNRSVRAETVSMASELYSRARTLILNRAVWGELWFGAMSDGVGFRLFDDYVTQAAFELVQHSAPKFGRGANDIVAEILKTARPIEGLLMRHSVDKTEPLEVDISDAEYGKDNNSYAQAMSALYDSTSFTIFPILTESNYHDKVIALYPTLLKEAIEPTLRAHRDEFRQIAISANAKIRSTLQALRRTQIAS